VYHNASTWKALRHTTAAYARALPETLGRFSARGGSEVGTRMLGRAKLLEHGEKVGALDRDLHRGRYIER
jgi:hypothetical protein